MEYLILAAAGYLLGYKISSLDAQIKDLQEHIGALGENQIRIAQTAIAQPPDPDNGNYL